MITRLLVRDFQNHTKQDIRLDPQITAIVGPSDTGKSALIRALRWLCLNKPRGSGFIRDGSKVCSVKLRVDKQTITRKKGITNSYHLDKRKMVSFGTEVPQSIANILNVGEVNFQGQHDPPFWFDLTPGELAKRLNDLVDLGTIDRVTAFLSSKQRKTNAEMGVCQDRLESVENQLAGLEHVPELDEALQGVEGLEAESTERRSQASAMAKLVDRCVFKSARHGTLEEASADAESLVALGGTWKSACIDRDELKVVTSSVGELETVAAVELPDYETLNFLSDEVEKVSHEWEQFNRLYKMADQAEDGEREARQAYNEAEQELLKRSEGICPICGGKLV